MMRIAINGFGRIGRTFLRALLLDEQAASKIEIVAINEGPVAAQNLDLLFKYDSVMREYPGSVSVQDGSLIINGRSIKLFAQANPADLPWGKLGIDWVIEASGHFVTKDKASLHLQAGAQKVLVTAPAKDADVTIIPGANDSAYDQKKHAIVSLGSCTTNCFALMVKVIKENFTLQQGLMTTIHAYTNDQVLLDVGHKDPRRARAAGLNIVPTKTGADKVIVQIYPELEGKIRAQSIRVPVPVVSLVDFSFATQEVVSPEKINQVFQQAASGQLKGLLQFIEKPLVSSDFAGNPHSAIFDSLMTQSTGSLSKVFAWYDNEFGYSARLKDFLLSHTS